MLESFAQRCRRDAWGTYVGDGRIVCRALGKYNVMVDANDVGLTPNLICDGFWEPNISAVFERYIEPGMTAVDIGANIGYFSLLMASRVGASGKVVAIEANPKLVELLRETIAMNALEVTIDLHNVAAAEKTGFVDFYIPADRNLNSCILLEEWRDRVDPAQVQRVPAMLPDDLLSPYGAIDWIKIDVEGAELLVWQGLEGTLHRNPGITVVLEYNAARSARAADLVPMIEAQGFPLRYIDADGAVRPADRAALLDQGTIEDWMLFLNRADDIEP
jgi:FkbM family methyltransferase